MIRHTLLFFAAAASLLAIGEPVRAAPLTPPDDSAISEVLRAWVPALAKGNAPPGSRESELRHALDLVRRGHIGEASDSLVPLRARNDWVARLEAGLVVDYVTRFTKGAYPGGSIPNWGDGHDYLSVITNQGLVGYTAYWEAAKVLTPDQLIPLRAAKAFVNAELYCAWDVAEVRHLAHPQLDGQAFASAVAKGLGLPEPVEDKPSSKIEVLVKDCAETKAMVFKEVTTPELRSWDLLWDLRMTAARGAPSFEADMKKADADAAAAKQPCLQAQLATLLGDFILAPSGYVETWGLDFSDEPALRMLRSMPGNFFSKSTPEEARVRALAAYRRGQTLAQRGQCRFLEAPVAFRVAYAESARGNATVETWDAALKIATTNSDGCLATLSTVNRTALQGSFHSSVIPAILNRGDAGDDGCALAVAELGLSVIAYSSAAGPDAYTAATYLADLSRNLRKRNWPATALEGDELRIAILRQAGARDEAFYVEAAAAYEYKYLIQKLASQERAQRATGRDAATSYQTYTYVNTLLGHLVTLESETRVRGNAHHRVDLLEQARDYAKQIDDLVKQAHDVGIPGLADRMRNLQKSQRSELEAKLKALVTSQQSLRRSSCDTPWRRMYAQQLASADPVVWLEYGIAAARCSDKEKAELAQRLRRFDFVGWMRSAFDPKATVIDPASQMFVTVVARHAMAAAALVNEAELATRWLSTLEGEMSSDLSETHLVAWRGYLLLETGKLTEAASKLEALLLNEKVAPLVDSGLREAVLHDVLKAYARADLPEQALWTAERLQEARSRYEELAGGAVTGSPESAEKQVLLRKALAGSLTSTESERLKALGPEAARIQHASSGTPSTVAASIARDLSAQTIVLVFEQVEGALVGWRLEHGAPVKMKTLDSTPRDVFPRMEDMRYDAAFGLLPEARKAGRDVYRMLLAPMGDIPVGTRVVFVLEGDLRDIPLEVTEMPDGKFLFEEHAVVYARRLWDEAVPAGHREGDLVVGVNGTLLEAEDEARDVGTVLGQKPLLGPDATVRASLAAALKAKRLHFATHAQADADNPYSSYIRLADGPLAAWQLFGAAAGAELIVLSACRTVGAIDTEGDDSDMASLAQRGGAKWVVSSRWLVDDKASRPLMSDFYKGLKAGADPGTALNKARAERAKLSVRDLITAVAYGASARSVRATMAAER